MEDLSGTPFDCIGNAVRKRRSRTCRRPRPDSQPVSEGHDLYPLSSTSPSDDVAKASSDETAGFDSNGNSKRKEFNLNNKNDERFHALYNNEPRQSGVSNKRCSEGVLAPANWKGSSKSKDSLELEPNSWDTNGGMNSERINSEQSGVPPDGLGSESRVKKVKLKVGGVTRTIQTNSVSNGASGSNSIKLRSKQKVFFFFLFLKNDVHESYLIWPATYLTKLVSHLTCMEEHLAP